MPWSIVADHPACDGDWAVVKDDDGTVEGCHPTEDDAKDQLAALNASEENSMTMDSHLTRTAKFTVTRATDDGDDGLTLEGYGAVFNDPTRIDSWEGKFDEVIAPGAFKKTIAEKGPKGIRLQFDHGAHPFFGSVPIGSIREIREDQRGLFVRARLAGNWMFEPIREAIENGSIDGMSFRFRVVRDEMDESSEVPVRTLREVELFEVGPVVWPAYESTSVGVRAREIARELMDPERRVEIARALLSGTPEDAALQDEGTSDEAAERDDAPPVEGTRRTQAERRQSFRRLFAQDTSRKDAA